MKKAISLILSISILFSTLTTVNFLVFADEQKFLSARSLSVGESIDVKISGAGGVKYFKFVPDEDGDYTFSSTAADGAVAVLFNSDYEEIIQDGSDFGNFNLTYYLNAGQMYYYTCKYYDSTKTGTFMVDFVQESSYSGNLDFSNAVDITIDEMVDVSIETAGDVQYFKFIPDADANYSFYSSGSDDTYVTLYNEYGEELSSDDDSGTDRNFKINYYLNAGVIYYFGSKFFSDGSTGNFQVTLTQGNISNIESIAYKSNSPLKEGVDNFVAEDDSGKHYNHYYSKCSVGDVFTVNYKDGSFERYTAYLSNGDSKDSNQHIHFESENGDIIECGFESNELQIGYGDAEIYENLYSVGENTTIAKYMGVKTEYNFTIEPTDIVNFKVTPISSTMVSLKYDEGSTNGYYECPLFAVDITYSDGRIEHMECNSYEDIYENPIINLSVEDDQGEWQNDEWITKWKPGEKHEFKVYCTAEIYDVIEVSTADETSHTHSYTSIVIPPTGTQQGYTKYTCSICGDTYNAGYFDAATVYSNFSSATAGSTIKVPVSIKNNTGILGWKLTFDYDTDVLTPISVDYGDVISGGIQDNIEGDMIPGSINVYWAGSDNEDYNGVMFYINFEVNQSAVGNTKIDITYSPEDTFDTDFNDVYLDCQPINLSITNNAYSQYAKINASADDVTAGDDLQLKLNISEINSVTKTNVIVEYNANNFEFKSVSAANGITVKNMDNNGKLALDISGITNAADNTDFVTVTFKCKDKAMSGNYDFSVSSADKGIICKGCTVKVKPSATSEVADIYADDVNAKYGNEITIPIYIDNNHGLLGYRLDFKYDTNLIQPISTSCGTDFANGGQFNDSIGVKDGEFKVLWNNVDEKFANGILLNLKFKVLTDEKVDTVISMVYSQPDTFNEKYEDVVFNCKDINVSLNNHQHSYMAVVTEPTCTEKGYTTYTCSCGDSYIADETAALGHSYGQWTYNGDAEYISSTNYKNGTQTRTCSVCGEEETIEVPNTALLRRRGVSLTLESSIIMNVMVGKTEVDYFDDVYVEVTRTTTEGELVEKIFDFDTYNSSFYKFIYHGVTPQGMNDDLKFIVYGFKDGVKYWGPEYHYSVSNYIQQLFSSTKSTNLKTLLADLVYYGYQYQLYTNYNTDNPLTNILTEEQLTYRTKDALELNNISTSSYEIIDNPAVRTGASLRIDSKVSIMLVLANQDESNPVDFTKVKVKVIKDNGNPVYYSYKENPEMFEKSGNYFNFYYDGVEAKESGKPVYFTVVDENNKPISNTRRYSIESYCYLQKDSSNQKLKNLCDALMRYCKSAEKYFANPNV